MKKKILLVGYPAKYFLKFSQELELNNFEIFWITALRSDYKFLIKNGVCLSNVCDVSKTAMKTYDANFEFLEKIEKAKRPYVNDIIMMDRNLRVVDSKKAKMYLNFVALKSYDFIKKNNPSLVNSWRDTAVQMIVMKVAKAFDYNFVIPTRYRLPPDFYGFCLDFETNSFVKIRDVDNVHLEWAASTFKKLLTTKPELKVSARSFMDVIRLIPKHSVAFGELLTKLFYDWGNRYNRYGMDQIISMYIRRRRRLFFYKVFNPSSKKVNLLDDYVYFPLHTQPESSIDVQASLYSNQIEFVKSICRVLPIGKKLYVKVHPTDVDGQPLSFFNNIAKIPGVVLVNYNFPSSELIVNACCVITMTGTAGMEAALRGIPVVTFSDNFYNEFPTVVQSKGFEQLREILTAESLQNIRDSFSSDRIIQTIAKWRANGFFGEVSRAYGSRPRVLDENDLKNLVKSYNVLIKSISV